MKTIRILSIGNSFTQDPHRYLTALAKAHGVALKCVNLMIGGCSLRTHYLNMLNDSKSYSLEIGGESTGFCVSIAEALSADDWDFVTLQQASHFSCDPLTYAPYAKALADYVRRFCPHAKLLVQQTWAYEKGSERLTSMMGYSEPAQMFAHLQVAYEQMAKDVEAYATIPSGAAMLALSELGEAVHRDTVHASLGLGRYLLSLVWLGTIAGVDFSQDTFEPFDEPITPLQRQNAIKAAQTALRAYAN